MSQQYQQPQYQQPVAGPIMVYAGFWWRVLAYIIDALVLGIPLNFLGSALGAPLGFTTMRYITPDQMNALLLYQGIAIVAAWLYFALLESSSWQGTIGKKALSLSVTDYSAQRIGFGQASGRFFAKILSGLILGIGFLMVAFTQRKQGLHDLLASTLVGRRIN